LRVTSVPGFDPYQLLRRVRSPLKHAAVLLNLTVFFVSIAAFQERQQPAPQNKYVGDEKCLSCHEAQKTYLRTAHHLTSSVATSNSIAGKFVEGENALKTSEPQLQYRMEARKDGFYQTAILGVPPDIASISERFDLVVGSGRKGQTYLFWGKNDQLFQLPVSYWTEVAHWVPSPGYDDKVVNFSRPILPRCLECHASLFEPIPDPAAVNRFRKSGYVFGISCERCHGPGLEHAQLNSVTSPTKPVRQAIVNPAKLTRERRIDLCGLCHGGIGVAKAPTFSYVAGEDLEKFIQLEIPKPSEPLDVHGNQIALLERSRCFQASQMTCLTCHNVHVPQRETRDFSSRCLACHKVQSCGLFAKEGRKIADKCVDCHLPNQTSNVIVSTLNGIPIKPKVRNHWIKVYPELRTP
jgi:Cytochrome c554 and c-prime